MRRDEMRREGMGRLSTSKQAIQDNRREEKRREEENNTASHVCLLRVNQPRAGSKPDHDQVQQTKPGKTS
jgi:hypothetical protein